MGARSKLLPVVDGFPRPEWGAIAEQIETLPKEEWQDEWATWSKAWLNGILVQLPSTYKISETSNFLVLSSEEDRFILLGLSVQLRLLVVVHCYRESDNVIRIISARKADRIERQQYTEYLS